MLSHLCVENIALIRRLDLHLDRGLTILTGETGAGKSIIIDALSLALGSRAESGLLGAGSDKGMVSAHFHLPADHPICAWLAGKEIPWMEDGLFLRRILTDKGRSRAFINETPVPLALLSEAGEMIAEIHGQHDNQSLLQGWRQRNLLDMYAGHRSLLEEVDRLYRQWREAWEERNRLEALSGDVGQQREFLSFQIQEILEVAPKPGEMEILEGQGQRLQHGAQLVEGVGQALEALLEGAGSATTMTHEAASNLEALTRVDPELTQLAGMIRSLHYELEDCGVRLRHYLLELETDPDQLEALKSRLDRIHRLGRKHHVAPEGLLEHVRRMQEDLDTLEHAEERREQLRQRLDELRRQYDLQAGLLRNSRERAAQALVRGVERQLADLRMAKTRLAIQVHPLAGDPRPEGMDDVQFLVSANPQEPLRPLKQVASGGELSRIMLALKTVLADSLPANTLVFDEVDVGIGGRVAASLGEKLAKVARGRQVLTITHLPQVAAWGHVHLGIRKEILDNKAQVRIDTLDPGQRVEELARMLAGSQVTAAAREHAQELLLHAGQPVSPVASGVGDRVTEE
ncbi:MAG: DNA repair protein RecN [Magnetococcales bacterium]|nr:DNA repair protein RecN [Magnetococcales bacterium]